MDMVIKITTEREITSDSVNFSQRSSYFVTDCRPVKVSGRSYIPLPIYACASRNSQGHAQGRREWGGFSSVDSVGSITARQRCKQLV